MLSNQRRFDLASKGLSILKQTSALILKSDYCQKQIAFALGKSEAWVSQALSYGGQSKFTIDQVPLLHELFGIQIIRILAEGAGCFVSENPTSKHMANFAKVLKEFADVAKATATAMEDDRITVTEAAKIREEWEHLKSAGEAFTVQCERGAR